MIHTWDESPTQVSDPPFLYEIPFPPCHDYKPDDLWISWGN